MVVPALNYRSPTLTTVPLLDLFHAFSDSPSTDSTFPTSVFIQGRMLVTASHRRHRSPPKGTLLCRCISSTARPFFSASAHQSRCVLPSFLLRSCGAVRRSLRLLRFVPLARPTVVVGDTGSTSIRGNGWQVCTPEGPEAPLCPGTPVADRDSLNQGF
jgi:hypothetical protein